MTLNRRLFYLLISWLCPGIIYVSASFVNADTCIVPESAVDSWVPFDPRGIWLYLLFYIYIPFTFLFADASRIKKLSWSFLITAVISGLIFVLMPTTIIFPRFEVDGLSGWCLRFVCENDTAKNCFPSLHGSLITLCTLANLDRSRRWRSVGFALLTVLMYYAILQVRRHVFIDLLAGVLLAVGVWWSLGFLLKRKAKS